MPYLGSETVQTYTDNVSSYIRMVRCALAISHVQCVIYQCQRSPCRLRSTISTAVVAALKVATMISEAGRRSPDPGLAQARRRPSERRSEACRTARPAEALAVARKREHGVRIAALLGGPFCQAEPVCSDVASVCCHEAGAGREIWTHNMHTSWFKLLQPGTCVVHGLSGSQWHLSCLALIASALCPGAGRPFPRCGFWRSTRRRSSTRAPCWRTRRRGGASSATTR